MTLMLSNVDPALRAFWHPVALEADVPADRPLAVRLLGEAWLLARLGGAIVAMRDLCPHRLVPLSAGRIVDDTVQCAYHGYRFDPGGRAVHVPALDPRLPIPARACVATARTQVRFGLVWLCLEDEPLDDLLDDAPYLDPQNDVFVAGPFETPAGAGILADNFLDCGHFPYLHAGTFGADDDGRPVLEVKRQGWRIQQDTPQVVAGAHLERSVEHMSSYVVAAPFAVQMVLRRPGAADWIWSFACPVDRDRSIWWMVHAYPLGGDEERIAAAREMQTEVGREDLWILEQMEDPSLPLDVRAEIHTKADAGCLEYRRMMADLVSGAPMPMSVSR